MNKTININLGGFFFHIDEGAFQKLRRYLDSISRSLSDDPQGKNEIIADIEARISELLSERITDARQVVNESDIDEIITIMGQPEDYAEAEEPYNDSSYSYKRNNNNGKKLFRDGDDKFLGGVAAGIAHYFNTDTIWIRLAFLVTTLAGFGTGILVYIVLWLLLPEAKTTAEKLQMEGEDVNIDNIEKKIREEFSNVSENVRNAANQASEKLKDSANFASEKFKNSANDISEKFKNNSKKNNGVQDFLNALGNIIMAIFKVVGKFIGVILIFVAAAVLISLIFGAFSVGSLEVLNIDGNYLSYPPFFYDAMLPKWLLTTFSFILIGIPFLILFVLGLRILSSSVKKFSKTTSLTLFGIWLIALLAMIFTGIEFGTSHAVDGKSIDKKNLNIVANDTLNINVLNDDNLFFKSNLKRNRYRKEQVEIDGMQKTYSNNILVDVEMSDTNNSYITIQKSSLGRNRFKANKNSEKIIYNFKQVSNTLELDAFYLSDFRNMFKDEEVKITVYVAKGVTVYFDKSSKGFLYRIDNTTNTYEREMIKNYFLMTEEGLHSKELKSLEELDIEEDE
jgi:phage shock protein PspC (stress-responsive transcriptional regulator)